MQLSSMIALGHCSPERSIPEAADAYSRLLRNLVRSVSQVDAASKEGTFD